MLRRKLLALNYTVASKFDPLGVEEKEFRELVLWLEEEKIRHHKTEDRVLLRDVGSGEWRSATLVKYLADLKISWVVGRSNAEILDQLLTIAVGLEYAEDGNPEKFLVASSLNVKSKMDHAPQIVAANPLDKLDFSSPTFVKGVNDLADILKITKHNNHLMTLEACAKLVKSRYSKESIRNGESLAKKGSSFPFQEVDKSFESGDVVLNHAAKILRLLFIMDLRDLQTKINECIVAVQSVTANPKTDTKLGQVGY